MKSLIAALVVSCCSLPAQATIRVNGPNLQAAIAAAKPGDILLVSGTFSALFRITINKPLFIHGMPGARIYVVQGLDIGSIPAGSLPSSVP